MGALLETRPLSAEDDLDALNVGNPMGWQAVWWRELTATMDIQWWVGVLGGEPAGFAAVCRDAVAAGGFGAGIVNVVPRFRGRGLGTLLRREAEEAARVRVPGVVYSYVVGERDAEAAVRAWALPEIGRHVESVLDLGDLDLAKQGGLVSAAGCEFRAFDVEEINEGDRHAMHAFLVERLGESPDMAGGGGDLPYDTFLSMVGEPGALLVAYDGDAPVGLTLVMARPGQPDARNTFFTGVVASARGRGIATALKTQHALHLREQGVTALVTQNMEGNEPILAANRRLGFVPGSQYVDVAVTLDASGGS